MVQSNLDGRGSAILGTTGGRDKSPLSENIFGKIAESAPPLFWKKLKLKFAKILVKILPIL
jgi:hypothetical protein